jgi:hypothetical protein
MQLGYSKKSAFIVRTGFARTLPLRFCGDLEAFTRYREKNISEPILERESRTAGVPIQSVEVMGSHACAQKLQIFRYSNPTLRTCGAVDGIIGSCKGARIQVLFHAANARRVSLLLSLPGRYG